MAFVAVRFGRVPKREKAKILAAMQKVNMNSMEKLLNEQLEDENRLLSIILQAHEETCDYTKDKVAPLVERARSQPVFASCSPQMVRIASLLSPFRLVFFPLRPCVSSTLSLSLSLSLSPLSLCFFLTLSRSCPRTFAMDYNSTTCAFA